MSTLGGFTCTVCGTWVPHGTWHSCNVLPTNTVGQATSDATIAMALGRIEALLEDIRRRLDALETKA